MHVDSKIYAFIDESGAFGWNLEREGTSKFFIVSAVIIDERDIPIINEKLSLIRETQFKGSEIKSNKIGKNHARRVSIINEVLTLPFSIFAIAIDKSKLTESKGLKFKKSFYKYCNDRVHQVLKEAFAKLVICSDEVGDSDYMKEFKNYVDKKNPQSDLFEKPEFRFENSNETLCIQLADLIAGTLAQNIEPTTQNNIPNYIKILSGKITRIDYFPSRVPTFEVNADAFHSENDRRIANISWRAAHTFVENYEESKDDDVRLQLQVIRYLITQFEYNKYHKYISTQTLQQIVYDSSGMEISIHGFRSRIIAQLRDKGVLIASCKSGYKIPSTEKEILDYIEHGISIIGPMLSRLKKCREKIKLSSNNEIDIANYLKNPEFRELL